MIDPADAIRARRRLTNRFIAGRETARLGPVFLATAVVIAGDGSVITGRDAILAAFASQFADPGFGGYVRTPERIEANAVGERAAEQGRWTAAWKDAPAQSGPYLAVWRRVTGQWMIESETFVTTS
ncbi:nuclear transport factor 2 family protein [Phenylobacterium sp.]|uniref:nuclear transport factor 2 family protein n=1 Tax=Phenylobacterium sp. TaxID=1871053 RepID=UPI0025D1624E|nr:nuclear transport factor 2 family protein [Phenylobacterium sp.]MCA3742151.1 nuclear transport factor 2 family protein [Phenylobacterium sp.]